MDIGKILICDEFECCILTSSLGWFHDLSLGQERHQQLFFTDGSSVFEKCRAL